MDILLLLYLQLKRAVISLDISRAGHPSFFPHHCVIRKGLSGEIISVSKFLFSFNPITGEGSVAPVFTPMEGKENKSL